MLYWPSPVVTIGTRNCYLSVLFKLGLAVWVGIFAYLFFLIFIFFFSWDVSFFYFGGIGACA